MNVFFFCAGTSTIKRMVKKSRKLFLLEMFFRTSRKGRIWQCRRRLINVTVLVELPETRRGIKGFVGGEAKTTTSPRFSINK